MAILAACRFGKGYGGADRRVASERQFMVGREDSHPPRVQRIVRRKQKDRLKQVELACDALHLPVVEILTIKHDRQRISGQWLIRENIIDQIGARLHGHPSLERQPAHRRSNF